MGDVPVGGSCINLANHGITTGNAEEYLVMSKSCRHCGTWRWWYTDSTLLKRCTRDYFAGQGKLDEADLVLVRAIDIQERALGPDDPSLATSLGDRAIVLKEQVREYDPDTLIDNDGDTHLNIR